MTPIPRELVWCVDRYQWYAGIRMRPVNYAVSLGTCALVMELANALPEGEVIVDEGSGLTSVMLDRAWGRYVHTIDLDPSYLGITMGDVEAARAAWPNDPSCTFHAFSVLDRENPVVKRHHSPCGLLVWDLGYPKDRPAFLPLFLDALEPRHVVLDDWHFDEAPEMELALLQRGYAVTIERERTFDMGARFAARATKKDAT